MMTGFAVLRFGLRLSCSAGLGLAMMLLATPGTQAQIAPECEQIGKLFQDRNKTLTRIQSWNKKTRPTPAVACNAFTEMQTITSALLPLLEANGAWCHIPDDAVQGLTKQQSEVSKVRANACKAAANMKKMEAQRAQAPKQGPLGGTGDVLGGPIRPPQGAL